MTGTSSELVEAIAKEENSKQSSEEQTIQSEISESVKTTTDDAVEETEKEASTHASGSGEKLLMSRMALNDNKAGMQGLDKERINQIIYDASKGNDFISFAERIFVVIIYC